MDPLAVISILVLAAVVVLATAVVFARRRRAAGEAPAPRAVEAPAGLRARLAKSRHAIADRLAALGGRERLDDAYWSEVEDVLVAADMGVETAGAVVAGARAAAPSGPEEARSALADEIGRLLAGRDRAPALSGRPSVWLVVGVNGGGKTTSIAKLAAMLQSQGKRVLLGAADTFRAAADSQLRAWAARVGVDIVGGEAGADPASVAFDALRAARGRGCDVLIVDTAGRLQSKTNLMAELAKVARVLAREAGALDEVLLVIDGTTGQNALSQARLFSEAVGVTGIVVTKLDGTARGGVAVAIERELDIPVKFIGVGEGVADLIPFEAAPFVDALVRR